MRFSARSFVLAAPLLLSVACGSSSPAGGGDAGTDAGTPGADAGMPGADAGTPGADAGMPGADAGIPGADAGESDGGVEPLHHMSYVPSDERPTSAARLIVMGDSISAGYGTTNPSNPNDMDTALAYYSLLIANDNTLWPAETNTTLTALFDAGTAIPIVNVAIPGETTTTMAQQEPSMLTQQLGSTVSGPSIVVITIGGNDMLDELESGLLSGSAPTEAAFQGTISTAVDNVKTVIEFLQNTTQFPDGVSIYLSNVYDPSDGSGNLPGSCLGVAGFTAMDPGAVSALTDLFNAYVTLGKQMDFAVIDALGHFHGHGLYAAMSTDMYYDPLDPTDWLYTDCIHPTNRGHDEMRRLFFEAIDYGNYTATED